MNTAGNTVSEILPNVRRRPRERADAVVNGRPNGLYGGWRLTPQVVVDHSLSDRLGPWSCSGGSGTVPVAGQLACRDHHGAMA
jgi:hypothetical protein